MAEYGFSASDISSMTQARQGLVEGFMQLGKQIQTDITRIATIREMKAFGQEMANLDPTSDAFPQQLIGTLSKYPLASNTPIATKGIEVLGSRYRSALQAKAKTGFSDEVPIGGNTYFRRGVGTYEKDPTTGDVKRFIDTTPNTPNYQHVNTAEGVMKFNPATGAMEGKIGELPPSRSGAGMGALSQNLRQSNDTIRAYRTERQKLIDQLKTDEAEGAAAIPYLKADDPRLLRIKEIERSIQEETQNARDLTNKAYGHPASGVPPMPTGAGQNIGGPSLMPIGTGGPSSNFVPMPSQNGTAAPGTVPNPSQMTLNEPGASTAPDQLATLPVVGPSVKQLSGPRLYRGRGASLSINPGVDPGKAITQAYQDQEITEEQARQYLEKAGYKRKMP